MVGTSPPGFVFPGAAAPFGMVQNSPDTRGEFAYSGYLYVDPQIQGFSLVHLSGPGVKKGGDIPFMPTVGPVTGNDPNLYGSPFDHAQEEALAGYYRVRLAQYATEGDPSASTGTFKAAGPGAGGWVSFDTTTGGTSVPAGIGISFGALGGARRNLEA